MMGITFNNKHSFSDFNLILNIKEISTPSKKKVKESIAGMNSTYDFSTVASGGEIVYNQRGLKYNFTLLCSSKAQLHLQLSEIFQWAQDTPQSQLIDDTIKDYYFMAELEDDITINEENDTAEITFNFIAEPFKTSINLEGNDIWDTFNFNEDVFQDVAYTVNGSKTITIINTGRLISPVINVTSNMTITINSKTFNLVSGNNSLYGLKLLSGSNSLYVVGNGSINFIYRVVKI